MQRMVAKILSRFLFQDSKETTWEFPMSLKQASPALALMPEKGAGTALLLGFSHQHPVFGISSIK